MDPEIFKWCQNDDWSTWIHYFDINVDNNKVLLGILEEHVLQHCLWSRIKSWWFERIHLTMLTSLIGQTNIGAEVRIHQRQRCFLVCVTHCLQLQDQETLLLAPGEGCSVGEDWAGDLHRVDLIITGWHADAVWSRNSSELSNLVQHTCHTL